MNDFTAENGATRVIPGSHRFDDRLAFKEGDTEPAEMGAGSILFYTGALYHGGGANRSSAVRYGLNLTYTRAWLRQEENQYLAVPTRSPKSCPCPCCGLWGMRAGPTRWVTSTICATRSMCSDPDRARPASATSAVLIGSRRSSCRSTSCANWVGPSSVIRPDFHSNLLPTLIADTAGLIEHLPPDRV